MALNPIAWQPIFQTPAAGMGAANTINAAQAHRVSEILIMTANVHRDRDFGRKAHPKAMMKKVNNRSNDSPGLGVPAGTDYNWMKITLGTVANEVGGHPPYEVVVVYHLLRHRLVDNANSGAPDPNYGFWSVSLGLHPRLIPSKWMRKAVKPTLAADPTVFYAEQIATRINADLKSFAGAGDPAGDWAVIFDEIDAADPIGTIGANPARKKTRIGRMGLVFAAGANATITAKFAVTPPTTISYPTTTAGVPIPGWAEDHLSAPDIVLTKIHAL